MKSTCLFLSCFFTFLTFGQVKENYFLIDRKMASMPIEKTQNATEIAQFINSNFKTETDKIRAVFYWTASNISYDSAKISTTTLEQTQTDRLTKTLKTKKGVCYDYSLVFNEIASLIGIKSIIITGYTKQNGKIDVLSHAWCAAKIDADWYLFDPTWGSGYVNNNHYTQKLNNRYYKVTPSQMIVSHMPFDYLWQFMTFPLSHQEFIEGRTQVNKPKDKYDFIREIAKYESLNSADQYFESAQRIEKNGIKNQLILEAHTYAKKTWKIELENKISNTYNQIVTDFNEAINELNDFIYYRNNKFKPNLSDDEILKKIQSPNEKLKKCQKAVFTINYSNSPNANNINQLKRSIADAITQSETHLQFVNNYISKGKLVRKTMFSKITWLGIPLN